MRKHILDIHDDDSLHDSLFEKIEKYFVGILLALAIAGTFFFIILK